jgi:hypothetical protein
MIVPQTDIDAIANAKVRKRTIRVPRRWSTVKHGSGTYMMAPPRIGSVHVLRADSEKLKARASAQPTRARAVLRYIDDWQSRKTVQITVLAVEWEETGWLLHFAKGDQRDQLDKPRFLARTLGYTTSTATALEPIEAISATLQTRYSLEANIRDLERRPPRTERDRQRERQKFRRRQRYSAPRLPVASPDDPLAV